MANQPSQGRGEQSTAMAGTREGERAIDRRSYQDPFSLLDSMFERMQREFFGTTLFNALMPSRSADAGREAGIRVPRVQFRDTGNAIELSAELPGIDGENVRVELEGDVLTISGEADTEESAEGTRVERYVSFYRQIALPDGIDAEQVESSFRNGVLSLRFPKRQARPQARQIPINTAQGGRQERGQPQAGQEQQRQEGGKPQSSERAA
jgi:HSP20 family protein